MLPVTFQLAPVTCHLSLTQTTTAPDPPPANSPTKTYEWCTKHQQLEKERKQAPAELGDNATH